MYVGIPSTSESCLYVINIDLLNSGANRNSFSSRFMNGWKRDPSVPLKALHSSPSQQFKALTIMTKRVSERDGKEVNIALIEAKHVVVEKKT